MKGKTPLDSTPKKPVKKGLLVSLQRYYKRTLKGFTETLEDFGINRPVSQSDTERKLDKIFSSMSGLKNGVNNEKNVYGDFSKFIGKQTNFEGLAIVANFLLRNSLFLEHVKQATMNTSGNSLYAKCLGRVKGRILTISTNCRDYPRTVNSAQLASLQGLMAQHRTKPYAVTGCIYRLFGRPAAKRANVPLNQVLRI